MGDFLAGDFPREELFARREVSRDELSKKTIHEASLLIRNSIYLTYALFTNSILYLEIFRVIAQVKFSKELNFSRGYFRGGGNFPQEKFSMGQF